MAKVELHSMKEIEEFVARGGVLTKLQVEVNDVPEDDNMLDWPLRKFIIRTAQANAVMNTIEMTLGGAEEPEVILLIGAYPELVKKIRDFSEELSKALDAEIEQERGGGSGRL